MVRAESVEEGLRGPGGQSVEQRSPGERGSWGESERHRHTNSDSETKYANPRDHVLEQVRSSGTVERSAGAVVGVVVGGAFEAERTISLDTVSWVGGYGCERSGWYGGRRGM